MKNKIKLIIGLGVIISPIWAFAVTDYYITIKNNTPYTLVEPGTWVDEGRGFQTSKSNINGGKEYTYEVDATSGPGGDTRVRGGIAYRINDFNNDRFMAGIKFNIDAHSDQSPQWAEAYTNGDDNLLHVDYRFTGSRYLEVTVTVAMNVFPYRFISLGLGSLNVIACGQHATPLANGFYGNPCKGNNDSFLSIGFANSPDLCRLTINSNGEIKDGLISCNMGTEARYIKDKSAIVFVCQSKGYGTSSCPWLTWEGQSDSYSKAINGTF